MMLDFQSRRKFTDRIMRLFCGLSAVAATIPLLSLLLYVGARGIKRLDWAFFTHLPTPVGVPGGGMANAVVGTISLILLACLVGLPIGIMTGIYLAEYGKTSRFAWLVRFTADVLAGVPSIVMGIVVYEIIVRPSRHFSAYAGGVALGFLIVPLVTRTTEELLKLVPNTLREASLALGVTRWRTILSIVLKTARNGILTGVLLAIARVGGETAPLLFTSFNNQFWSMTPNQPTASLTVQVFTYAVAPYEEWQDLAWTGALVLILIVLLTNLAGRLFFKSNRQVLR